MAGRLASALVATSALSAQAFLIPAGINTDGPVELLTLANHDWQTIKLPCPDCVLSTSAKSDIEETVDKDGAFVALGGANSLLVNVTTIYGGKALGLDDYPLYPPLGSFNKASVDIVPSSASLVEMKKSEDSRTPVTVSADTSFVSEEVVSPEGDAVIHIKYHILSVDNHPVTVDSIEITALKAADNSMTLIGVEAIPTDKTIFDSLPSVVDSDKPKPPPKQCDLPPLLCHWREMLEAKLGGLKSSLGMHRRPGCHGKGKGKGKHLPTHIRPDFGHKDDGHRPDGHHGKHPMMKDGSEHPDGKHWRHQHHGQHRGHRHAMMHRVLMALAPFLMFVSYFMLGALTGFIACRLGMLVGMLIVMAWRKFGRGGRRGYESVAVEEDDTLVESRGEEVLPVYSEEEAVPVYEEKQAFADEKH